MNPTDEELIRIVKMIGIHVRLMDIVLMATVNGMNEQNKMLSEKLPSLTPDERKAFLNAIRKNETTVESLEASSQNFHAAIGPWLSGT